MTRPDLPDWICQTCHKPLEMSLHPLLGSNAKHRGQDTDDHPAIPIKPPAGWDQGECDFCGVTPPEFVLPARDFDAPIQTDPDYLRTMGGGGWSACAPCAELLRANDWGGLLDRHVAMVTKAFGEPPDDFTVLTINLLWSQLRRNVTGPLRPIRKATP